MSSIFKVEIYGENEEQEESGIRGYCKYSNVYGPEYESQYHKYQLLAISLVIKIFLSNIKGPQSLVSGLRPFAVADT